MCKSKKVKAATPAGAPPPGDPNVVAPARLFISRPKPGAKAGVAGLVIRRK